MLLDTKNKNIKIPSMGGEKLNAFLKKNVKDLPNNTSIVEVGVWLGSGTYQLASLLRENSKKNNITIHCYDRWKASESEARKASSYGLDIKKGDDTLPIVKSLLSQYLDLIEFHQCDLANSTWNGGQISIYIDDAAKSPELFYHVLKTFGPFWIPGKTIIILMDYYYWKKEKGKKREIHRCQQDFIEKYEEHFELISDFKSQHNISFSNEAFYYKKSLDFTKLDIPIKYRPNMFQTVFNKSVAFLKKYR